MPSPTRTDTGAAKHGPPPGDVQRFTTQIDIVRGDKDTDQMVIAAAVSSDVPYKPWARQNHYEVLVHDEDAIDLSRFDGKVSAPVMMSHSSEGMDQVGVVESGSVKIEDGKLRCRMRFSKHSEMARQVYNEIADGIRQQVSIGAKILEQELIEEENGKTTLMIRRWQPIEVSVVPVAADADVGPGRSLAVDLPGGTQENSESTERDNADQGAPKPVPDNTEPQNDPVLNEAKIREEAEARARLLHEERLAEEAKARAATEESVRRYLDQFVPQEANERDDVIAGMTERAMGHAEPETRARQLMQKFLDDGLKTEDSKVRIRAPGDPAVDKENAEIAKLFDGFSLTRGLNSIIAGRKLDGIEAETNAILDRHGVGRGAPEGTGLKIPIEVMARAILQDQIARGSLVAADIVRTLNSTTGAGLFQTDRISALFRATLRSGGVLMNLGSRVFPRINDGDVPVGTAGMTAAYSDGEQGPTGLAAQNIVVGSVSTQFRTLRIKSEISRKTLRQAEPSSIELTLMDIGSAFAEGVDLHALQGTGTGAQPTGVNATTGVSAVNVTTDGQPTFAEMVQMQTDFFEAYQNGGLSDAEMDVALMDVCYLTTPGVRGHLITTPREAGDARMIGETMMGMSGQAPRQVIDIGGYNVKFWTLLPANTIYFGKWSEILHFYYSPGIEVRRDEDHDGGGTTLRAFADIDSVVRTPQAFVRAT